MPLAEGGSELLLLWLPAVDPKSPFPDGVLDVVLVENQNRPNPLAIIDVPLDASLFTIMPRSEPIELVFGGEPKPEKAVTLGNVTLDTALSTVPKLRPVELAFEEEPNNETVVTLGAVPQSTPVEIAFGVEPTPEELVMLGVILKSKLVVLVFETGSLATAALAPNRPRSGDAVEMRLLEDVAFEPTGLRDEDLGGSFLGDAPSEAGNIPNVDEGSGSPDLLLLRGDWVDASLTEGVEFDPEGLLHRDAVLFRGSGVDDRKALSLLLGTLFEVETPKPPKFVDPEFFLASFVAVLSLFPVVTPVISAVDQPGLMRGFTAHVCALNSSP